MAGKLQKMWVVECGHKHHREGDSPDLGGSDFTAKASESKQKDVYAALDAAGWEMDPKEGLICPSCATMCDEPTCARAKKKEAPVAS